MFDLKPETVMKSSVKPIVPFFRGEAPDSEGRLFSDILAWPDEPLEYTHDYIQWLFPTRQMSAFNPDAPVVDDATVSTFHADEKLRDSLAAAFQRMAVFYGFDVIADEGAVRVIPASNWMARSKNWLTPNNHNMLRITRILTSLRLLGLHQLSKAFFEALDKVYSSPQGAGIGPVTYQFWKSAAE
jgi:hypothetical protein